MLRTCGRKNVDSRLLAISYALRFSCVDALCGFAVFPCSVFFEAAGGCLLLDMPYAQRAFSCHPKLKASPFVSTKAAT